MAAAGEGALVEAVFLSGGSDGLPATLRDGLESRISFRLRCYERRPGLSGLLGDELLAERVVNRVAFYDGFDRRFVVETDGESASYADEAGFLTAFFALHGVELAGAGRAPAASGGTPSRYVAAMAQYDPVLLSPPLTILTLFRVAARLTTPWVRRDVPPGVPVEAAP